MLEKVKDHTSQDKLIYLRFKIKIATTEWVTRSWEGLKAGPGSGKGLGHTTESVQFLGVFQAMKISNPWASERINFQFLEPFLHYPPVNPKLEGTQVPTGTGTSVCDYW